MSDLRTLVELSRFVGAETPRWTQGAGGNLSLKSGRDLFIKATGKRLSEVTADGLARLSIESLRSALENNRARPEPEQEAAYAEAIALSNTSAPSGIRPSMEAGLHVTLASPWVFHFHSLAALLMAHLFQREGRELLARLEAGCGLPIEIVPATLPGWDLCRAIGPLASAPVILLENHGLLLQADDALGARALLSRWKNFEIAFCRERGFLAVAEGRPPARQSMPFRKYFPDSWMLEDRIRRVLEPVPEEGGDRWRLEPDGSTSDRDAAEIWAATILLYLDCPELSPFPESLGKKLADMPTEKLRMQSGAA